MDPDLMRQVEAAAGRLRPSQAAVLRCLAWYENPARRVAGKPAAFPAIATIALEIGVSERQIKRIIKELSAMGALSWERRGRRSSSYTLAAGALAALAAPRPSKNVENVLQVMVDAGEINGKSREEQGKIAAGG